MNDGGDEKQKQNIRHVNDEMVKEKVVKTLLMMVVMLLLVEQVAF